MTHAPIVQILFTLQFAEPMPALSALEIAAVYAHFAAELPEYAQIDAAGPMPHRFEQRDGTVELPAVVATMPRVQIKSADGSRVILFQNDRFSYGWVRTNGLNEDANYPGYEPMRDAALYNFHRFCAVIAATGRATPVLLASELAYTDGFPDRDRDGEMRRLSSIFTFLRVPATRHPIRGFEYGWNEEMDRDGVLVVKAYGPIATPNGITAAFLQTTATFPTPAALEDGLKESMDWAHRHITTIYKRVVEPVRREEF